MERLLMTWLLNLVQRGRGCRAGGHPTQYPIHCTVPTKYDSPSIKKQSIPTPYSSIRINVITTELKGVEGLDERSDDDRPSSHVVRAACVAVEPC